MNITLENKTFLVAGGSHGIGLALARKILAAGGTVHVCSRTLGDLPDSERLKHHVCDFTKDDMESIELPETVHGAVYCPGTINLRSFRSLKLADFRNDYEVNVAGAIKFLKRSMAALKRGADVDPSSVLLFSTVAVSKGLPMHASVAAAKGALEGLARTLAAEWAPSIRVNALAPALTDTPLAANFLSTEEKRTVMNAKYPLGRVGTANDLASMAAFLLSPDSSWITGQVLHVDGGMSTIGG